MANTQYAIRYTRNDNPVIYVPIRHLYNCRDIITFVGSALQIALFMQNKANFPDDQMNVASFYAADYENKTLSGSGKNKANSKPNKANFRNAQMNVNLTLTKDYRKKDDFAVQKNKPNSNPISVKPKMSANLTLTKNYDNVTAFRLQKNKPNQTQSLVKDLIASVNAWMFIGKTAKNSCGRCLSLLQSFQENFDKPGEPKTKGKFRLRLRTNPKNLLGIMPAKEGKIDLKHSFYGSAFCFMVNGFKK